jgi:hypothetical protein
MRGLARLVAVAGALLATLACANPKEAPYPIEGSTYRIEDGVVAARSELNIDVFENRDACRSSPEVDPVEIESCLPRVDRASGQVHVSFILRDPKVSTQTVLLPLQQQDVEVSHDGSPRPDSAYELIPHGVVRAGQLFILLIDGSGSMYKEDMKIEKVQKALLNRSVVDGFYPGGDVRTGVILLRFTDKITSLDGGAPTVLTTAQDYRAAIRDHLVSNDRGYTHLYEAVRYAVDGLTEEQEVAAWLRLNDAEPTIIALTDGFNNEAPSDTCSTNAPRLQETLTRLLEVRSQAAFGVRPRLYTVGLGEALYPEFEAPKNSVVVSSRRLCGPFSSRTINGGLEEEGIDNASLEWLATVGGGLSYVERDHDGLAKVFAEAAAERHKWYELIYESGWFQHRRPFETRIRLRSFAQARATVRILPGAWLDAPTGNETPGSRWVVPTPLRHTASVAMPLLGLLVLLSYAIPAAFNARRTLFRRLRRRR